jgi:tRNA dimethylallyltransferase
MNNHPLLIILGPTASGKTKLAVRMAATCNGEVISADSRQVFRGMDIGTGKDLNEYRLGKLTIPYHLINIREAGTQYNVNAFKEDFYRVYDQLNAANKLPVLCGGTGMYIHTLLQNQQFTAVPVNQLFRDTLPAHDLIALRKLLSAYPESSTAHADLSSAKRMVRALEIAEYLEHHSLPKESYPELKPLIIGLGGAVEQRRERIYKRLNERFEQGLILEVQSLLAQGISPEMLIFYGLEYKFVTSYLLKELTLTELKEKLYNAICQFAKRQMTFFRKMEKDGVMINWLDSAAGTDALAEQAHQLCLQHSCC